jgi:hypothetical protein
MLNVLLKDPSSVSEAVFDGRVVDAIAPWFSPIAGMTTKLKTATMAPPVERLMTPGDKNDAA